MKKQFLMIFLLGMNLFLAPACKKDNPAVPEAQGKPTETVTEVPASKERFVSAELVASLPASALQLLAASQGYGQFSSQLKYDVDIFKINYLTAYKTGEVTASGLVCLPKNMPVAAPILSAQHGTTFADADAPSNMSGNGFTGFEVFASNGYITVVPDFIGYGSSKHIFHPYYDQKHSALSVVDIIKAAKTLSSKQNVKFNDKLFLVGYSEGGYVTLAAQKEIETNPAHKLTLTAVAAGAGGYDLVQMLGGITTAQAYPYPAYLAFILQAYNHTNSWNRPLTDFFNEPYASRLPGLFNGINGGSAINNQLSRQPKELFNPKFYNDLKGDGELQLKQALVQNSFNNWAPKSPTRLYHGTADDIVPFQNSQVTFNRFVAAGASRNVAFIPIQGGTHSSSLVPMINNLIPWIQSFK